MMRILAPSLDVCVQWGASRAYLAGCYEKRKRLLSLHFRARRTYIRRPGVLDVSFERSGYRPATTVPHAYDGEVWLAVYFSSAVRSFWRDFNAFRFFDFFDGLRGRVCHLLMLRT